MICNITEEITRNHADVDLYETSVEVEVFIHRTQVDRFHKFNSTTVFK